MAIMKLRDYYILCIKAYVGLQIRLGHYRGESTRDETTSGAKRLVKETRLGGGGGGGGGDQGDVLGRND